MSQLILFNKPFQVLCQFRKNDDRPTLADFINIPDVYAAGRLDYDSEGLLLLTADGALNHQLAHPKHKKPKIYWVQVDGDITTEAVDQLKQGVTLKDGPTKPARVKKIDEPDVGPRNPPIRVRKNIPTSWIEIQLTEGKNRQVRRMTAHVGFPTVRLIRAKIGDWDLTNLLPGEFRVVEAPTVKHNVKSYAKKTGSKSRPLNSKINPTGHNQRRSRPGQSRNRTT